MSKAFASNDSEDEDTDLVPAPVLPPGTPNYVLPSGFAALETERNEALAEKAALNAASVENQTRLKRLDRRIEFLTDRLNIAQVIDPLKQPQDRVLFGAAVTVDEGRGAEQTWRIVGVDETDLDKGWISWISPLARALLEKKVNETAVLGARRLTVKRIAYPASL